MSLVDFLNDHSVPMAPEGHTHSRPGWVNIDCPSCGRFSEKFHLGISLGNFYCNCWKCGRRDVFDVLSDVTGAARKDIFDAVRRDDTNPRERIQKTRAGKVTLPKGIVPLMAQHRRYLTSRNFKPDRIAHQWSIASIGQAARLQWRVFIPIFYRGRVVSWTTRSISKGATLRYISAKPEEEEIGHKDLLYGEDNCKHSIVVHEGPIDAWAIGPGATCTFGTSYSDRQIARIAKYPRRAICFDNSPDAQRRAAELCDILKTFDGETFNVQLDAKDAAESSKKERAQVRKHFLK